MEICLEDVLSALYRLRAPFCPGEYDLHALVVQTLLAAGISCRHEVRLAPRCRIDLMAGRVGIEIKRGKPDVRRLLGQLQRYAASDEVTALILLVERKADLPAEIGGKPCVSLSVNKLWGIAL